MNLTDEQKDDLLEMSGILGFLGAFQCLLEDALPLPELSATARAFLGEKKAALFDRLVAILTRTLQELREATR